MQPTTSCSVLQAQSHMLVLLRIEQLFSKHDSKTNDSQDQYLRRTLLLAADRQRHLNQERLDKDTMRTLKPNEHGIVGKERAIHADKDLRKLDQSELQCSKLMEQMHADCSAALQRHGGELSIQTPACEALWCM